VGLENLTGNKYISDLDSTNPVGATDFISTADDHLRGIKNVLKQTFPNLNAAVSLTPAELNLLAGLIDLNFLHQATGGVVGGAVVLSGAVTFSQQGPEVHFEKNVSQAYSAANATGVVSVDTASASWFNYTFQGVTTFSFDNPPTAGVRNFTMEMLNAAGFPPVWPASVKWAGGVEPIWSAGTDIVSFVSKDQGTSWYAFPGGFNFA